MSQISVSSYSSFDGIPDSVGEDGPNESKLELNTIQKSVRDLLSDDGSTHSSEDETQYGNGKDPEMRLIMSALEKSVNGPGAKAQNKTFTEEKIRDIERINTILMRKILSHNRRANQFNPAPKTNKVSNASVNRRKQQKQIDRDNLILLRKIQTVKSYVPKH